MDEAKIIDTFKRKHKGDGVLAHLDEICNCFQIESTTSSAYCYSVKIDANGSLRTKMLIEYICKYICDYIIPRKEIEEAKKDCLENNSTSSFSALDRKALGLLLNSKKTGEGGELLLYILANEILDYPQLINKMTLKTSSNMPIHGSDGIHVNFNTTTNCLDLYWCESKMYKNLSSAILNAITSIKNYLLEEDSENAERTRDISLITADIKTLPDEISNALLSYFDTCSAKSSNLCYKGICFIGFDSDKYSDESIENLVDEFRKEYTNWCNKLSLEINKHKKLSRKEMHIFLIPFKSVEEFRSYFLECIGKK